MQGDNSAAFLLLQGTKVTGNIFLSGGGIVQNASVNSTASNSIMVDLEGPLNGNLVLQSGLSGVGPGMIGVQTIGGIHSCASDTAAPAEFSLRLRRPWQSIEVRLERLVTRIILTQPLERARIQRADLALGGDDPIFLQRVRCEEHFDARR